MAGGRLAGGCRQLHEATGWSNTSERWRTLTAACLKYPLFSCNSSGQSVKLNLTLQEKADVPNDTYASPLHKLRSLSKRQASPVFPVHYVFHNDSQFSYNLGSPLAASLSCSQLLAKDWGSLLGRQYHASPKTVPAVMTQQLSKSGHQVRRLASFYDVTIEKYALMPSQAMSLRQMIDFGKSVQNQETLLIKSAQFVQKQMPVRLARRLLDLQFLPYIVVTNPHIKQVYDAYYRAFQLLRSFKEVKDLEDNRRFTDLLTQLVDEQTPLLSVLGKGVRECASRPLVGRELDLDNFLNNMLRSRISRRVIAEQHICLQHPRENYIGVIHTKLSVAEAVAKAVAHCQEVCRETYGVHPEFSVLGDTDTTFAYIPAHLDYMLFEILKNASRAVVEHHLREARRHGRLLPGCHLQLPPILVRICRGLREVTFQVSDKGGGIDEDQQEKVWTYGYTTAEDSMFAEDLAVGGTAPYGYGFGGSPVERQGSPMAGLGFGLPLSRLHAQYFGGNVQMVSIPGYGTDIYLRVHRLGDQSENVEI